jgi:hypothetical protein
MKLARGLRLAAILIALAGVIDPSMTRDRSVRPIVAVIAGPGPATTDPVPLADRVVRALDDDYLVVRGPAAGAAATIVTGLSVPEDARLSGGAGLAVLPPAAGPDLAIVAVRAPARASLESRVRVDVTVRSTTATGAAIALALEHDGVVVDRASIATASAGRQRVSGTLQFVPVTTGPASLRLRATLASAGLEAAADLAIEITDAPWRVLVFDRRPSWASTFVRRALEADPRFRLEHAVIPAPGIRSSTGVAARPADASSLMSYDAVIVGGASELSAADVAGLSAFARERGGAVILLLDDAPPPAVRAMAGAAAWRALRPASPAAVDVSGLDAGLDPLTVGEALVADALSPESRALAKMAVGTDERPVVVEAPAGAGRVIVSGAADAWRHRGAPDASPFDAFWRLLVARAAAASPPPVSVALSPPVAGPGERVHIAVTVRRDAMADTGHAGDADASIAARLTNASGGPVEAIRLWPDTSAGRWVGTLTAPSSPGPHLLTVTAGANGDAGAAPLVVQDSVSRPTADDEALLGAWATSRGGIVHEDSTAAALRDAVSSLVPRATEPTTTWPMRSAWWIVPFAMALAGEWWIRRKRDLR